MKPDNRPMTIREEEELNEQHLREICHKPPIEKRWPPTQAEIREAEKDKVPF